jgi:hypothetical protein
LFLNEIEPDFNNSCRTVTAQNVAFMNLNGALDIKTEGLRTKMRILKPGYALAGR